MIPYSTQTIDTDDIKAVNKILKSNYLTSGPNVKKFEKIISKYTGSKYTLSFNSATSALHASCLALGLGKGDYFWTVQLVDFYVVLRLILWISIKSQIISQ